ncbi:MAG TPA: GTPase domain-containing protein, partial [Synergistaceae bacterium]|nr:GTPase domain-containing protein [Synergistaceae bacterium]
MLRSKKCKLALMGAHGVGKTIFFGSYFYQTTQLGRGCCSISVKKSQSMDAIAQIMKKLFQEHTVVTGTVERIDLSFEASPPLGLDVEFYDVPGGHTQDSKQWVEENILPDLQKAHGVLFFVSAEDALKHKDRILKDNIVFGEAISYIRKDREGKRWRQDVPIYFLFTKCDLIPPEVSLEELEAGIPALIKAAKESGKFVRSWKVTSLGKWIDPSSPPEEYNPENVLEPMESMLEEVKKSCSIWTRKKMVVAALAGLLAWGGLIGLARTFDQNRWDTARREIEQHIQMERFPKAIGVLDGFYERIKVPYLVLPEFLTPGPDAEEFRRGLYQKYEKYAYSALEPYLDVDLNAVPQGNPELFKEAAEMVRAYLENSSYFYGINPEHYEKVRAVEAYYEVGKLFLSVSGSFDPYQQPGEMFASAQALLQLEKETPPEWRENLHQRTETLIRDWVTTFPLKASPQE